MIVDSHAHIGKNEKYNLDEKTLIDAMEDVGISYGLISSIECMEYMDFNGEIIEGSISQIEANRNLIRVVKANPLKLRGVFWVRPHTEELDEHVRNFIIENKDYFVGMKIHPYGSRLPITDVRYESYLRLACDMGWPVAVHTSSDEFSNPRFVYERAKEYPGINFVMVHMGLYTDHSDAIRYIGELPNLYGDTTWVEPKAVIKAVRKLGSDKILFGTDAPIDGADTYRKYDYLIEKIMIELPYEDALNVLFKNAVRVFNLGL